MLSSCICGAVDSSLWYVSYSNFPLPPRQHNFLVKATTYCESKTFFCKYSSVNIFDNDSPVYYLHVIAKAGPSDIGLFYRFSQFMSHKLKDDTFPFDSTDQVVAKTYTGDGRLHNFSVTFSTCDYISTSTVKNNTELSPPNKVCSIICERKSHQYSDDSIPSL